MLNKDFFSRNRQRFVEAMAAGEGKRMALLMAAPICVKTHDNMYKYRQDNDFYYLTGIPFPHSAVILYPDGDKNKEVLFIENQSPARIEWEGKAMDKAEASERSGIKHIQFVDDLLPAIETYAGMADVLYINPRPHKLHEPPDRELTLITQIRDRFPTLRFKKAGVLLTNLRLIKFPEEVALIQKAIDITADSFVAAMKNCRPGQNEAHFQAYLEYQYKLNGATDIAFLPIVGSGKNATILHYEKNDAVIPENALLLLDSGVEYHYYASDITRTFPVSGRFTSRQREVYQAVLDLERDIFKLIKPGVKYKEFNETVQKLEAKVCQKLGLKPEEAKPDEKPDEPEDAELREARRYKKYWKHGVSHSLGLDVHDVSPGKDEWVFAVNNVLTVEPGIYIEDEGLGVRIEDDVLITETGLENLSVRIPKEVDELEALLS